LFNLSIFTLIILVPSLLIGARFGVIGIAWGHLIAVLIRRVVSLAIATRFVNVTLWDIFSQLVPSLRAGLVMLPLSYAVLYATAGFAPIVQLILVVITGAVSYLGVAWWTEKENLFRLLKAVGVSKKA
jgi:ethanolamine transporter EutH